MDFIRFKGVGVLPAACEVKVNCPWAWSVNVVSANADVAATCSDCVTEALGVLEVSSCSSSARPEVSEGLSSRGFGSGGIKAGARGCTTDKTHFDIRLKQSLSVGFQG